MRPRLLLLLSVALLSPDLLLSFSAAGQSLSTFYYDDNWVLTREHQCTYVRTCTFDLEGKKFIGEVKDHTKGGMLVMTGHYNKDGERDGIFRYYYKNGKPECEGEFKKNSRVGVWKYFYENGKPMQAVEFRKNDFVILSYYDSTGKKMLPNGTGDWTYVYDEFGSSRITIVGQYVDNKRNGEWTCQKANGDWLFVERYDHGKFKGGTAFEREGDVAYKEERYDKLPLHFKHPVTERLVYAESLTSDDYPFIYNRPVVQSNLLEGAQPPSRISVSTSETVKGNGNGVATGTDSKAAFPGGGGAWASFLAQHFRYPREAGLLGVQGTVYVSFVVKADGTLSNFLVTKGIGAGCDEEAVRVIKHSPAWIPAKRNGQPIPSQVNLPIKFQITWDDPAAADTISLWPDSTNTKSFEQASFPGGLEAMAFFLAKNMKYPRSAQQMGVEGSVMVSFTVKTDGTIADPKITKGIQVDCDAEALRVVKLFPPWVPAKINGQPVETLFTLPIRYKLGEFKLNR